MIPDSSRWAAARSWCCSSPWPGALLGVMLAVIWMGWLQWKGLQTRVLSHSSSAEGEGGGVVELWVHGVQPMGDWVPFVHPPGYTIFMNGSHALAGWLGLTPAEVILLQGWGCRVALVLLLTWAVARWLGPGWGVLAAAFAGSSPNGLRPFEHYPLASLLSTMAVVAIVELSREGGRKHRVLAVVAVLVSVMLHLSSWFLVGGAMAAVFFFEPSRRRDAVLASLWMIGLFLLTTYPGLYEVLAGGVDHGSERQAGGLTIEWTNPLMLLSLLLLALPLWPRAPGATAVLGGGLFFVLVTFVLQEVQWADGQPYPSSLHYFELVDPLLVLASVWLLHASWHGLSGRPSRWAVVAGGSLLLVSQLGLSLYGQKHVFLNRFWFWVTAWPFGEH